MLAEMTQNICWLFDVFKYIQQYYPVKSLLRCKRLVDISGIDVGAVRIVRVY